MNTTGSQSNASKWGWRILLAVSVLLALNGVSWLIVGPSMMVSFLDQMAETPSADFSQTYPAVANAFARNARQVAIWITAFSLLAIIVARYGSRHRSRWAWNAMWVLIAAPAVVGIIYSVNAALGFDNLGNFTFAALALLGQLLTRSGLTADE
jgi:hypothetical protein